MPGESPWSKDSKSTVVPEYCAEQNYLHGATKDAASLVVLHLDLTSSFSRGGSEAWWHLCNACITEFGASVKMGKSHRARPC